MKQENSDQFLLAFRDGDSKISLVFQRKCLDGNVKANIDYMYDFSVHFLCFSASICRWITQQSKYYCDILLKRQQQSQQMMMNSMNHTPSIDTIKAIMQETQNNKVLCSLSTKKSIQ